MIRIRFTICGNQKDNTGNAIPYKRVLSGKFRKDSVDYMEWKEYVRSELDRTMERALDFDEFIRAKPTYTHVSYPYPLLCNEEQEVAVHVYILWKNGAHGDGDNVLKGIMDALFENDKCVWAGSFESRPSPDKCGRVEVVIEIDKKKGSYT